MDIGLSTLILKTLTTMLVAVLPVTIKTNSGDTVNGDLIAIESSAVRVDVAGQDQSYPFDDLASLAPSSVHSQTGPTYRVTLVSGSRIAAEEVLLSGNELTISPRRQPSLRVPVKQVKSIRFRAAGPTTDPTWLGIVGQPNRGDTLVIRRGEDRLDPQSGIIEGIAEGKVAFDLDGDKVNAPIDRLEGVVFGGTDTVAENSDIRLTDVYGSVWLASHLEVIQPDVPQPDQALTIKLTDDLSHSIPPDQIESIRWSGGLVLLASEPPAASVTRTYFETKLNPNLIEKFFAPQADGDDLTAVGGSTIEYRIDPGYHTLAGSVQRVASINQGSRLKVQIELDGTVAWEQELTDAQARGFELPVGQARRVAIKIDNAGDSDLGDSVRIVRLRLTK